jgi:hypothetical protein
MSEKILDKKPLLDGDLVLFPVAVINAMVKATVEWVYSGLSSVTIHHLGESDQELK